MIRRILRFGFVAGLLGGASFALVKYVQSRRAAHELPPESDWLPPRRPEKPLVEPEMFQGVALAKPESAEEEEPEGQPEAQAATETQSGWVEPDGASCPASHPVKAKLSSGIFHLPGMLAYERTVPDRCYVDEAAAEADGLRKAKR